MRSVAPIICLTLVLTIAGNGVVASSDEDASHQFWRMPESDGVNSLCLLLRVHGIDAPYDEVGERLASSRGHVRASDLVAVADTFGLHVVLRRLHPADLEESMLPMIVYMEQEVQRGQFSLLVFQNDGVCFMLSGGTMVFQAFSEDFFRRHWSGYGIIVTRQTHRLLWLVVGVAAALCYGTARLLFMPTLSETGRKIRRFLDRSGMGLRALTAILVLPVITAWNTAQATELPVDIRKALEQTEQALSSIVIHWTQRDLVTPQTGKICDLYGCPSPALPRRDVTLMWTHERSYALKTWFNGSRGPEEEIAVNGDVYYKATLVDGRPTILQMRFLRDIVDLDVFGEERALVPTEYFEAAGFRVPTTCEDFIRQKRPQSLLLNLLEEGMLFQRMGTDKVDGAICTLIEVMDREKAIQHRLFLDPAIAYSLRRREERTLDGVLELACNCSRFQLLEGTHAWLPRQCVVEHYFWQNIPAQEEKIFETEFTVISAEKKSVPDEQFSLDYSRVPGTWIHNGILPEARSQKKRQISYRVPVSPDDLDRVIEQALHGLVPVRDHSGRKLFLFGNLFALLLFALIATYRWRRGRHMQNQKGSDG